MVPFLWFWATNLYHKMNDIKILREFAKINSCCEDLKTVNRLEKVVLMYRLIGKRKAYLCGGERGIRTLGTVARTRDFQSRTFGHSVISPQQKSSAKKIPFGAANFN